MNAQTLLDVHRIKESRKSGAYTFDNLFDADRHSVGGRVIETIESIERKAVDEGMSNITDVRFLTAEEELSLEAQTVDAR